MDMKSHTKCRLTSSDPIPYIRTYSMGLPKGSQHNWIINHEYKYINFLLLIIKPFSIPPPFPNFLSQFAIFAGKWSTGPLVKTVHTQR